MDAVEFLRAYKLRCGQFNCSKDCPILKLREQHEVEVCDDAFIYLHPDEVVSAVEKWARYNA